MAGIEEAIKKFADLHPEYSTKNGAKNKCIEASHEFIVFLLDNKVIKEEDDFEVLEVDVIDGCGHCVAKIKDSLVDWTYRQFNLNTVWPKIGRY